MTLPAIYGVTTVVAGVGAVSPDFTGITAAGRQLWAVHRSANEPIADPPGWTDISNSGWGTGTAGASDATRLQLFKMNALADGTETTLELDDSGSSNLAFGFATDPVDIDVIATPSVGAYTTTPSFPSATTTGADRLIFLFLCNDSDVDTSSGGSSPTNAALANFAEQVDRRTNQGNGGGVWFVTAEKATAGAIGTTSGTYASSASGAVMVTVTMAVATPSAGGDTITAGKASAAAGAFAAQISAGTTIVAGKATATATAHAVSIQSGISIVLGKAVAAAQARAASIVPTTMLTLGKATATAAAHAASVTAGLRIVGGKAVAAASALAASIVETTALTLGKATATASARHASISDGSAPADGGLLGGLIVNVGRLLSRF